MLRRHRPRRWDATKRSSFLLVAALASAATPATTALARDPGGTATPTPTVAPPAPAAPVDWFPIRRDVGGGEVKLGCTHQSRGSAFGFECGGHHSRWALDVIAGAGTPVHAVRRGFATDGTGRGGGSGYGNVVRIDHGDGIETIYAHLSEVLVPAEGAWVDETTVIGLVGSTGSSSTPHLHYERRAGGEAVDPGPLAACHLGRQVAYPQVAGHDSWARLPWGAFTMSSDGTDCAAPVAAEPASPVRRITDGLQAKLPTGVLLLVIASVRLAATGA